MDYRLEDARFTAIFVRKIHQGREIYERVPMDLVRFDVDINPDGQQYIMPCSAEGDFDVRKRFEKIWTVDGSAPYREKTSFNNQKV